MKAIILYAHPNPASYNHAILEMIGAEMQKRGAEYKVRDLYAMGWDPRLSASDFGQIFSGNTPGDIAKEQEAVKWADTLFFIFPIWWASMPAILKGWVDRVFSLGFAYEMTEGGPKGLLAGKKAVVITTSGADRETAEASGQDQAVRMTIINGILGFCGITGVVYRNLYSIPYLSDQDRKKLLEETGSFLSDLKL